MALELTLKEPGYEDWVKGGLALKYARDGIENFVQTNTDTFHQGVMNNLPAGANCRNCSTENIISCRNNNNFCKIVNRTCKVHDPFDPRKKSLPVCPNYVCDAIRSTITKEHRFNGPSWKNTDCTLWSREPWQLAKCYMPDGYRSSVSAADTDFPGLLSVVINNKVFDNVVSDNLASRNNVFCQARQVRNEILHTHNMKLTVQELADHIAILDAMLSDNQCLAAHPDAANAKVMLNKLLTGQINISSEDERQVRALRELEQKKQESLAKIKSKTEDAVGLVNKKRKLAKDEIESRTKKIITTIEKKSSDAKKYIKSVKKGALKDAKVELKTATEVAKQEINFVKDEIKTETKESIKDIIKESRHAKYIISAVKEGAIKDAKVELKTATEVAKQEINLVKDDIKINTKESLKAIARKSSHAKDHIKSVKEGAIKNAKIELKAATDEAITALTTAAHDSHKGIQPSVKTEQARPQPVQQSRKLNSQMLKVMKTALIRTYQKSELLSAPLFPLVPNKDMKTQEFYVKPYMQHKGTNIDSYKEIFQLDNQLNTNIYVVGEAGSGKTSFCQNMISTWCRVQSETFENMSDNEKAMTQFDILFYVSLREAVEENGIEEMIKNQLLDEEYHEQVSEVLTHEGCLVILDGLDEWSRKNTKAKLGYNKGIPGRKASDYLTVLTTTRPWKLDAIQLKQTQIGTRVELLGIEETSSKHLIQMMLIYVNKDKHKKCHMVMDDFLIELAKRNIEHFMSIPVILKQLICLWTAGKDLGQKPTEIYCQTMELLLELAQNRLDNLPAYKQIKAEWLTSTIQLPSCFDGNDTCQEYKPLIFLLSKLAFNAILIKDKESALVFERKHAVIHGMTEFNIDICLNIGILSQSGIIKRGKSQRKLSFLHKSYHEFLAALFITLDLGGCDQHVQRIQQHCTTLSELLEMEHLIQFIGGICSSVTLCTLLSYIKSMDIATRYLQIFIKNGLKECWCCSHDNEHLFADTIDINPEDNPEHVGLLCQVNIKHMSWLTIRSPPMARCIEYLQQVHTLERLRIEPSIAMSSRSSRFSRSSPISEDIMNDLVPHVQNRLSILTKSQLTQELSSLTSSKSTPISEDDLNDLIQHHNNIIRILFERGVVIETSRSSSTLSINMIGENNRNDYRQQIQILRDSYIQRNVTFESWSSTSSSPSPECERYIYDRIEAIQNAIDRRTERESATVSSVSSSSTTRSSNISEYILYDMIQKNSHTLTFLYFNNITFQSKTKLSTLLNNLPRCRQLFMYNTTLPQQLLESLRNLKRQRPHVYIDIKDLQILPDIKCTE